MQVFHAARVGLLQQMFEHAKSLVSKSALTSTPNSAGAILLFGEVLADCFLDREVVGGAPFNVARHLIGLGQGVGIDPVLVTRIGKDALGSRLMHVIRSCGLAIDGVQLDLLRPSGQVQVTLDAEAGGHRFDIAPDQAWDFIHADMARLIGLLCRPQWIYFGTLAQRGASKAALRTLLQTTHAHGFLDLNLRDPWVSQEALHWSLSKAEIVKLNADELFRIADLLGCAGPTPKALGEQLIGRYELRQLLVTEGDKGAWLLDSNNRYFHSQSQGTMIEVVDSVGAGDAFSAVFLLGLLQAWPVEMTLDRAHRFAGEVCKLRGAIPESDDFYLPFVTEWQLAGGHVG